MKTQPYPPGQFWPNDVIHQEGVEYLIQTAHNFQLAGESNQGLRVLCIEKYFVIFSLSCAKGIQFKMNALILPQRGYGVITAGQNHCVLTHRYNNKHCQEKKQWLVRCTEPSSHDKKKHMHP